MTQEEIDTLIKCRNTIDSTLVDYLVKIESYIEILFGIEEQLKLEGFISLSSFLDYSEICNMEEFKRCMPIFGTCDWCGEELISNQVCIRTFEIMNKSLSLKGMAIDDDIIRNSYNIYKKNGTTEVGGFLYLNGFCKIGHGYYMKTIENKEPLFNIFWISPRSIPANSNWTKEEFQKSSVNKIALQR